MPTLTIMFLVGFLIGPVAGVVSAIVGVLLAGFIGYGISRRYGDRLVNKQRLHHLC